MDIELYAHKSKFLMMELDNIFEKQCNLFTFFPHDYKLKIFQLRLGIGRRVHFAFIYFG